MRVFLAGASGVIGVRLVPLLVRAGHDVAGMTRTPAKADTLRGLGADPVVCDVYDADGLLHEVVSFAPELVLHELTDLPDDEASIAGSSANARIRREGTRNLLAAAQSAGAARFVAQSIAWDPHGEGAVAKADLERMTLEAGGVVLRYGRFYGPGTYHDGPRRTVELLDAPSGIYPVVED